METERKRSFNGFEVAAGPCRTCAGKGQFRASSRHKGARPFPCEACQGKGYLPSHCTLLRIPPPKIRPEDCDHVGVSMSEVFHGNGRAILFRCNACEARLQPIWKVSP